MDGFGGLKAVIAMVVLQCITAGVTIFSKVALSQGMSSFVFVAYRQTFATIIMAPLAIISRWRNPNRTSFGIRSFSLILLTSIIGVTANNNTYFVGLSLSSSTIATAMLNLIPASTFVFSTLVGLEKIDLRSLRSIAKIVGTIVCIGGGICMALIQGPEIFANEKILTQNYSKSLLMNMGENENLLLGCLFLFINCCCNSFWIVMQVPISEACPDHLYTTFWMFLLSSAQSLTFTLVLDRNLETWLPHSLLQLQSCLVAAVGEAASFFIQVWCISQTGPVFAVIFTPVSTVIATSIAVLFFNQNLYVGSLVGAIAVIVGLYVVLWGKANDIEKVKLNDQDNSTQTVNVEIDETLMVDKTRKLELHKPLLLDN